MSVVRIVKRVESLSHATRRISALHKMRRDNMLRCEDLCPRYQPA